MRVICINRFFWPDHSATSQLLTDLAFHLAAKGNAVTGNAVTGDAVTGNAVTVITGRQLYGDAQAVLAPFEIEAGVAIVRVWSTRFGRAGLPGRALDYVSFYVSAFWVLLWRVQADDVVLAKTDPPMLSVVTALLARLKRIHGVRVYRVNWLQDLFPEVAQAAGIGIVRGAAGATLQRLRDWSLRGATNVVLGERMAALLSSRGVSRLTVVPNWADGAAIEPERAVPNPLRVAWQLQGKFVIGYSGNLGRVHDAAAIIGAAERLRGDAGVVFLFIGSGKESEALRADVESRGLSNVLFQPYQPRDLLGQSLTLPDVHLVSLRPVFEGFVVPSKFYGIAAAGRPCVFIGDADGEIARLLREGESGLTVPDGDGAALAEAILGLRNNPARAKAMGTAARRMFEARFDRPVALARWDAVLAEAAGVS